MPRKPARPRPRGPLATLSSVMLGLLLLIGITASTTSPARAATLSAYAFTDSLGIAIRHADGTYAQLTTGTTPDRSTWDDQPAISPSGNKVAFTRGHTLADGVNRTEIYTVPIGGGAPVQVTSLGSYFERPSWLSETELIAPWLNQGVAYGQAYRISLSDGSTVKLTDAIWVLSAAACHDGRMAYDTVSQGDTHDLHVASATDGSGDVQLTSGITVNRVAWTPDCRYILFDVWDPATGHVNMFTLSAAAKLGDKPIQLTTGNYDTQGSVGNDWVMAYVHGETGSDIYTLPLGTGSQPTAQSNYQGGNEWPAFAAGDGSVPAPADFPPGSSTPPPSKCPTLQIVGVRGSGETAAMNDGLGPTVAAVKTTIASKVAGTGFQAINYPAVKVNLGDIHYGPNYLVSVDKGRAALSKFLFKFFASCPATYVVIVGYSQGAQVALDAAAVLTSMQQKHIAALIGLGDPRFSPKQTVIDDGDYDTKLSGSYLKFDSKLRGISGTLAPRTHSYCTVGDPVCSLSSKNLAVCAAKLAQNKCAHQLYIARNWTSLAALWAVKHWRGLPKLK
ncbi:MAG: hypothetical protein JWN01_570 [Patescibacteria group bacterium]|nr:hypothetical protein [Patescibacteria group bacterium]